MYHIATPRIYYAHCSPEERFTLTNNRSISSNCYTVTKFSAVTFILFTGDSPKLTTNLSGSIEKQTFHSVQSLSSFVEKADM